MTEQQGVSRRRVLTIAAGAAGASIAGVSVARAGQDAAENREVPRHSEGRPALRELQAVPTTIGLQSRGWNYFPARLVHGLCEGLG
jgi:hypothetical protein